MSDQPDLVIVGAGLMGAACAWAATRAGLSVTVLEQFAVGHDRGSSHGSARILRRAYGDDLYTELSGRALALWRELEHESGRTVLRILGGIDFGAARDVVAIAARLAAVGAEHEIVEAEQAQRRWPGMRFSGPVVYHRQAGALDPETAIAAFLTTAQTRGAVIREQTAVRSLNPNDDDGVDVHLTTGQRLRARCAVLAVGGWLEPLAGGTVALPALRVTQQQVFHFARIDPAAPPWPSVIHDEDGHGIYHLAGGRDGGPGDDRKIGEHHHGTLTSAAGRDGRVDPDSRARVIDYVRRWLPGLHDVPTSHTTCLYTTTPSEDFLLDRVGALVVCSPCSGHGAKFAPLVGELVTGLVLGTAAVPDRFRLATHALGGRGTVSL